MLLSSISLALTRLGQRLGRWSPLALWPDGVDSPGMWSSPSTLPASFNDSTGTTLVATPGSVADSANPVGLALDIRAGAPGTLGPELITGTPSWVQSNWTDNGGRSYSSDGSGYIQFTGATAGASYEVTFDIADYVTGAFCVNLKTAWDAVLGAAGTYSYIIVGATGISFYASGLTATINNLSVREIPGNHMLQATSAGRPLESARVNLLTKTEDFGNAAWGASNGYITVSGNKIIPDNTNSNHYISQGSASVGITHTISVIAKQSGFSWLKLVAFSQYANFNLLTGEVGENYSGLSRNIVDLGGGYYLCTFTYISVSDIAGQGCIIKVGSGDNASWDSALFSGNGVDGIEISNVQLELGLTATTYQAILTDGSSYSPTGFPIYQKYDGVDDGMATASFAAGTLINGMDCMIAVRRDSGANAPLGICGDMGGGKFTGFASLGDYPANNDCGSPTVWVNNVQVSGGTNVRQDILNAAVPVGEFCIFELRNLDLSGWTRVFYGYGLGVPAYILNGARGDILLFPSTASTEDKDAARQYLADLYGVTLP